MTDLETAFYIIAIIYMGLMFVLFIALLIAVLVIKKKIDHMHALVDEKVNQVKAVTGKMAIAFGTLRHFIKR